MDEGIAWFNRYTVVVALGVKRCGIVGRTHHFSVCSSEGSRVNRQAWRPVQMSMLIWRRAGLKASYLSGVLLTQQWHHSTWGLLANSPCDFVDHWFFWSICELAMFVWLHIYQVCCECKIPVLLTYGLCHWLRTAWAFEHKFVYTQKAVPIVTSFAFCFGNTCSLSAHNVSFCEP